MRVLFVGASGRVGSATVPHLAKQFDLVLAAHEESEVTGLPVRAVDITDFDATLALIQDSKADAVVNCAIADPRVHPGRPQGDDEESRQRYLENLRQYHENTIEVNVRGAYHLYEAAARAEIGKFVFISSMTVVMGLPKYEQITGDEMPRVTNFYACTKHFGEQTGYLYATTQNMSVTCLRLGQPYYGEQDRDERSLKNEHSRSVLVHMEDIAQAIACALRETKTYTVYPVVSTADVTWVEPAAMQELGYVPRYYFSDQGVRLREDI